MPATTTVETATVTVNVAFLQEIKENNQELRQVLSQLREITRQSESVLEHCRELIDLLAELRDQVAMHFSLEEAFGYFDDPLDVPPHLCERVAAVRQEHVALYSHIVEIVEEAEAAFYGVRSRHRMLRIGRRFHDFDHLLQDHEDRENALIFEAFDDDIGVGD